MPDLEETMQKLQAQGKGQVYFCTLQKGKKTYPSAIPIKQVSKVAEGNPQLKELLDKIQRKK